MKISRLFFIFSAFVVLFSACDRAHEQKPLTEQQKADKKQGLRSFPAFDPKTVVTVKGQIIDIYRLGFFDRPGYEIELILRTDQGDVTVQLGPDSFVDGGPVKLQPMDTIEVKGSKIYFNGNVAIVAQEVSKDNYKLKIRNDKGQPLWTGWIQLKR